MKNIKYLILVLISSLLIIGTTGCSDFLDKKPDDYLTMEMIFSDKIRTEDWLAGVYSGVPNPMWGYFKEQGWNIMSDDMTIPSEWQPFGWICIYCRGLESGIGLESLLLGNFSSENTQCIDIYRKCSAKSGAGYERRICY